MLQASHRTVHFLYASTIFLSAFLLFLVQPIAGKHLLPYFGGSSSVWATSLLFFTGTLFAGYLYVFLLTRCKPKVQILIHGALAVVGIIAGILAIVQWHSLFSSLAWTVGSPDAPAADLLLALTLAIGIPYFLLSTTGPLLQYWWGVSSSEEPYALYALSNVGSFIALLSYPFIIEPVVHLIAQELTWLVLFCAYALLLGVICMVFYRAHISAPVIEKKVALHSSCKVLWVLFAMLPSIMLVAVTSEITQTIAPVPLLWVLPLALYLATFILAFRGIGGNMFMPVLILLSAYSAYSYWGWGSYYIFKSLASDLSLFFFTVLYCHARLYRMRPTLGHLPLFYVLLSLGGMLGVFVESIVAPLVLSQLWDFPIAAAVAAGVAVWGLQEAFFPRILEGSRIKIAKVALLALVAYFFVQAIADPYDSLFIASRNFYGAVKVRFTDEATTLVHGLTIHGSQPTDPALRYLPNSYYLKNSGLGRSILYEKAHHKSGVRIGVLGLGTGSISAYCDPGDTFVFYEIDPRMEFIARNYFTYLRHCKGSSVRLGDGRLVMTEELREGKPGGYDVVAIDAFVDDSIPVHLITLQAVEGYAAHLRSPQSIIAIHTSNRYVDLPPVILKIASQMGFAARIITSYDDNGPLEGQSQWVVLSRDPAVFSSAQFKDAPFERSDVKNPPLWTDDHAAIIQILKYQW